MLGRKTFQLRPGRDGAVRVDDFGQNAGRSEPCEPNEVRGCFGMAAAAEDAPFLAAQRKDVPRARKVPRPDGRISQGP